MPTPAEGPSLVKSASSRKRAESLETKQNLCEQFRLLGGHRVIQVQLVTRPARVMSARGQPFILQLRPDLGQLFIGPFVHDTGIAARRDPLLDQSVWRPRPAGQRHGGI